MEAKIDWWKREKQLQMIATARGCNFSWSGISVSGSSGRHERERGIRDFHIFER